MFPTRNNTNHAVIDWPRTRAYREELRAPSMERILNEIKAHGDFIRRQREREKKSCCVIS